MNPVPQPRSPYNIERFLHRQNEVFARVLLELAAGQKRTHWMWYIFPQLKDLARSYRGKLYGLADRHEAKAFLNHPILGKRLQQCVKLALEHDTQDAAELFGEGDDQKFKSSMTLFSELNKEPDIFDAALRYFFKNMKDPKTLEYLQNSAQTT